MRLEITSMILLSIFIISCSSQTTNTDILDIPSTSSNESFVRVEGNLFILPPPRYASDISVETALYMRRSTRSYLDKPLLASAVSQIAWAAQGQTHGSKRTAPSAGSTYPITLFVAVSDVENIPDGIYEYLPGKHALEIISMGDPKEALKTWTHGQDFVLDAPVVFIIAGNVFELESSFSGDSYKYMTLEAGHVSQNIYLQAQALALGTVAVGSIDEENLKTDVKEMTDYFYLMPVGFKRR